jgi:hypothetical protein
MQPTAPALTTDQANLLGQYWGYQATLPDGTANPQTLGDFINAQLTATLNNIIVEQTNRNAQAAAATSAPVIGG